MTKREAQAIHDFAVYVLATFLPAKRPPNDSRWLNLPRGERLRALMALSPTTKRRKGRES